MAKGKGTAADPWLLKTPPLTSEFTMHRDTMMKTLGIAPGKDFSTFEFLGNIGTVSVPLTAALAEERGFLKPGDRVGFMGIGSGLNCMMLGLRW